MATEVDSWLLEAVGGRAADFYAELGVEVRGDGSEAAISCFADPDAHKHGDRNKSASINLISGLWMCHGCGAKGNAFDAARLHGYNERDAADLAKRFGLFLEKEQQEKPRLPNERQLKQWNMALLEHTQALVKLHALKGWTPRAIHRLQVGWDGDRITFPIRDHKLRRCGLVRYKPLDGQKMISLPGTKRNLFPPPEGLSRTEPIFVVEGEPAAVSVWSAGRYAVAIPGASSWRSEWSTRFYNRNVVLLPDCDVQGRRLMGLVKQMVPHARLVELDRGRDDGWDVGDMIAECANSNLAARALDVMANAA